MIKLPGPVPLNPPVADTFKLTRDGAQDATGHGHYAGAGDTATLL